MGLARRAEFRYPTLRIETWGTQGWWWIRSAKNNRRFFDSSLKLVASG